MSGNSGTTYNCPANTWTKVLYTVFVAENYIITVTPEAPHPPFTVQWRRISAGLPFYVSGGLPTNSQLNATALAEPYCEFDLNPPFPVVAHVRPG